jgi:hypothetical protein
LRLIFPNIVGSVVYVCVDSSETGNYYRDGILLELAKNPINDINIVIKQFVQMEDYKSFVINEINTNKSVITWASWGKFFNFIFKFIKFNFYF